MKINGFTLVEMMVVVAIIGIMAAIVGGNYQGARQRARLEDEAQKVTGFLEEARSNAVAAREGRRFGVEVGSGQYRLFSLDDNDVASPPLKSESLPSGMNLSSGRVVFGKLTGIPETTPTVNLEDDHYYIEIKITQAGIKKEKIKLQE